MTRPIKEYIQHLLYHSDKEEMIEEVKSINESKVLHLLAKNYNFDQGFVIPNEILNNSNCDLGTALMIFYNADGYRILENKYELNNSSLIQWKSFILSLYERIVNNDFKSKTIQFVPPLSKVQIYKLMKISSINNVFVEEIQGVEVSCTI